MKFSLNNLNIRSEIWVGTQAIMFAVLIFANLSQNYEITPLIKTIAYSLEGLAVGVGLLAIYNLRRSLSVAPKPTNNGQLQTMGLYKYIRHPMYLAVFLVSTGVAINSGSYAKFGVLLVLIIFFRIKTGYEEGLLVKKYPGYKDFQKKTGRYFPRLKALGKDSHKR